MKDLYYGAELYPELWPEETVDCDIQNMVKIGMNFTRIGEFIWDKLEPQPGNYQLQWLDSVLDKLATAGISVILCTPTATPPRWLTYHHEERLVQNINGNKLLHGSRQHVCFNNDYFVEASNKIAVKIGEIAARHDNVIGIQLDNEFKAHVDLCYCENCKQKWVGWLESKYHTIDALNTAWGTDIWSERYDSFDEVVIPGKTPFIHNASLQLNYAEFTQQSVNQFVGEQVEAIHSITDKPITHNSAMGFNLDNYGLFKQLDFTSFDTYAASTNPAGYLINIDIWKSMNKNPSFMLMETSTAHAGHIESFGTPHPAGYLQTEAFMNYAAGGITFNYWHYRGHRFGVEQPHASVVTSWGEPGMGYSDVVKVGKLASEISPLIAESKLKQAKVALIYSDRGRSFMNIEKDDHSSYRGLLTEYYSTLINAGIQVDVIPEQRELAGYSVLLVPYLHYVSEELLARINEFVEHGGKCILGPGTSDRGEEFTWPAENGLESVGKLMGLSQINQISGTNSKLLGKAFGITEELNHIVTIMQPGDTAISIGRILDNRYSNKSWLVEEMLGSGCLYYLGGIPKQLTTSKLWHRIIELIIKNPQQENYYLESGVAHYVRETTSGHDQYWLANMTGESKIIELPGRTVYQNVINNNQTILSPFECRIIELQ